MSPREFPRATSSKQTFSERLSSQARNAHPEQWRRPDFQAGSFERFHSMDSVDAPLYWPLALGKCWRWTSLSATALNDPFDDGVRPGVPNRP